MKQKITCNQICRFVIVILFLTVCIQKTSQSMNPESDNTDPLNNAKVFEFGFVHQHQNFFGKAFSYQGLECKMVFNQKLLAGLYGATFVSNLKINVANNIRFINIAQFGVVLGEQWKIKKHWNSGWLINTGYFNLKSKDASFRVFSAGETDTINGLVLSPQIYGSFNVFKCMKLRTGLAYNFYLFEENISIKKKDLQNFSLNFGFIFGK